MYLSEQILAVICPEDRESKYNFAHKIRRTLGRKVMEWNGKKQKECS